MTVCQIEIWFTLCQISQKKRRLNQRFLMTRNQDKFVPGDYSRNLFTDLLVVLLLFSFDHLLQ